MAEGARLESVYTARYPGFESLSLRQSHSREQFRISDWNHNLFDFSSYGTFWNSGWIARFGLFRSLGVCLDTMDTIVFPCLRMARTMFITIWIWWCLGGGTALCVNRTTIGTWEKFYLINLPDGKVALKTHDLRKVVSVMQ